MVSMAGFVEMVVVVLETVGIADVSFLHLETQHRTKLGRMISKIRAIKDIKL